jgi:membrane protein
MYFVRFVLFCIDATNDFLDKNCQYIAGAIAFYTLFSMFPLVLALISVWGFFLGPEVQQSELAERIAEVIPVSTEFISSTMHGVASARVITGTASFLGLLWASSAAFGAVRKGINAAWGITKTRPFISERLIDLGLVAGAGIVILILLVIAPLSGTIQEIFEIMFPDTDFERMLTLLTRFVSPLLAFGTFLVLYKYLPNTSVGFKDVWMGALMAALAFDGAKWGLLWYVETFPVYNVVYGPLGAMMALLTWVYVSAIILLFGALLTSRYANITRGVSYGVRGHKLMWTGLTRVRLRVVATGEAET